MYWLDIISTFWPIAAFLASLVVTMMPLWLRTMFPTKADLKSVEDSVLAKIDAHEKRLQDGSTKLANLDKRVALVEEECEGQPSRHDLNQAMAVLAGRMSGVESSVNGLGKQLATQHDYVRTLLEKGLKG